MRRRRPPRNDRAALLHAAVWHLAMLDRRRRLDVVSAGDRQLETTVRELLTGDELALVVAVVAGRRPAEVLGPDDDADGARVSLVERAGVRWGAGEAGGWQPVGEVTTMPSGTRDRG